MVFITHTKSRMRRLISVYLDGELDRTRTRRLMAHLEVCDRCRAELAAGRQLSSTIASALHKGETPDILADVLVALNREKQRRSHGTARLFHRTFKPAFAYGAAAALRDRGRYYRLFVAGHFNDGRVRPAAGPVPVGSAA